MRIDELTIGEAKELAKLFGEVKPATDHSYKEGTKYFIRTVTYHYTGRLERVTATDLVLSEAAWIAESARWAETLTTGKLSEVEPYPDSVIIPRAVVVDASVWTHELPREVK